MNKAIVVPEKILQQNGELEKENIPYKGRCSTKCRVFAPFLVENNRLILTQNTNRVPVIIKSEAEKIKIECSSMLYKEKLKLQPVTQ